MVCHLCKIPSQCYWNLNLDSDNIIKSQSPMVETVSNDIDPKTFYKLFVAKRTPVIIKGLILDPEWKGGVWTNQYLREKCGDCLLQVEKKQGVSFGKGIHETMTINQFLTKLESSVGSSYYLTTQDLKYSEGDERPDLVSPPVSYLLDDIPAVPSLMGNLIPQNVNLWIGSSHVSENGASSGLHHDYHDNLYLLLKGHKKFRLFPPSEALNMYTYGDVATIHPNGRIMYRGQLPIRSDGSSLMSEAALIASEAVDRAAFFLEKVLPLCFHVNILQYK
jgi:hypothetical protein